MNVFEIKDKPKIKGKIRALDINQACSAGIIVDMIAKALNFKIVSDQNGISAYGGNSIRISDHRTYMQTWIDNNSWNAKVRLDIVIEDSETQARTDVQEGYDFTIVEFVYKSAYLDPNKAKAIAFDIQNVINGQPYANNAGGEKVILTTTHISRNNTINCNRNMKQTIKLTEERLRVMIQEAVKDALTENSKQYEQSQGYLGFLEEEGYTEEAIHKVAKDMAENGIESLKDGNREVLCIAFDQNDNLMYSLHQRGWRHIR